MTSIIIIISHYIPWLNILLYYLTKCSKMQNNACMLYKGKIVSNKYYLWCTMKKLNQEKRPKKNIDNGVDNG